MASGIVILGGENGSKIEIKPENKQPRKVSSRYVFKDLKDAETKCEYWNHWGKYHKNIDYRGRKKK